MKEKNELLDRLTDIVSRHAGCDVAPAQRESLRCNIAAALEKTPRRLTMVLPGFPFKSTNRTQKVSGALPDAGEEEALKALSLLCEEIAQLVPVEHLIVSDGHVFNDLLDVPDEEVDAYFDELRRLNSSSRIRFVRLKDLYAEDRPAADLRRRVIDDFAENMEDICARLEKGGADTALYCGMKRFMEEERPQQTGESKRDMRRRCASLAKLFYQRSQAYSGLIRQKLPDALRLTIHPREDWSEKIPVRLVSSGDRWATPWHNVAVHDYGNKKTVLMHRKDAEKAGFKPEQRHGKLWRYVV